VDAEVVVIGAGALGLSTALHCALAGRSVEVLDRQAAGSQASGRAAGLFKSVQADELRTRLARRSIARAVSFADWAAVPLAVASAGSFLIARTARHRDYLGAELAQSRRWGADVREATAGQLAAGLSYYRPGGDEFALWCPEDVYIDEPASLIRAYLAACRRHGAVVAEHERVTGISVTAGRVAGVAGDRRSAGRLDHRRRRPAGGGGARAGPVRAAVRGRAAGPRALAVRPLLRPGHQGGRAVAAGLGGARRARGHRAGPAERRSQAAGDRGGRDPAGRAAGLVPPLTPAGLGQHVRVALVGDLADTVGIAAEHGPSLSAVLAR
jgi:hypothetical protein